VDIADILAAPEVLGRPAVLDGAMGTELAARGVEAGAVACVEHPEAVLEVHRAYVEAGADAILTNTFSMTRLYAQTHGIAHDPAVLNRQGALLARQAAAGRPVLGDMSSTGRMLEPLGECTEAQCVGAFREQAGWLAEAGCDALIIETMSDLREARCALRGALEAGLPVVVSMTLMTHANGGRTMMGDNAADCAAALEAEGASAFGLNCGQIGPLEVAAVVETLRGATRLPLVVQPNAGKPELAGGRTVFRLSAADFAAGLMRCVAAGAAVVGGCCGTTPEHIRALGAAVRREG